MQQLTFMIGDAGCIALVGTSRVVTLPGYLSIGCPPAEIDSVAGVGFFSCENL